MSRYDLLCFLNADLRTMYFVYPNSVVYFDYLLLRILLLSSQITALFTRAITSLQSLAP